MAADDDGILELKPAANAPFFNLVTNAPATDSTFVRYVPWDSGRWTQIWQTPTKENNMDKDEKRELIVVLKQMVKDKQLTQAGYTRLIEHFWLEVD